MLGRRFRSLVGTARKRSRTAANFVRSKLDIGDYWFWVDEEALESEFLIWPIIFPLRYDVLIRKSFFEFYVANRDLYVHDFHAFMALAKQHPYYEWFRKVMVTRYLPRIRDNEECLDKEFESRVVASANLYESIAHRGFDKGSPIVLYTGQIILPADTGRKTNATYYMGDGCHRLACLMAMGCESLPRQFVRIKCFKRLIPLDNTRMLQSTLSMDKEWSQPPGLIN
jgi:hypothetical protein